MTDFENLAGKVTFNEGASNTDSLPAVPGVPSEFRTTEHFFIVDSSCVELTTLDGISLEDLYAIPRDITLTEGTGRSDIAPGEYTLFPKGPLIAKDILALPFQAEGPVVVEHAAMIGHRASLMGRTVVKTGAGVGSECLIDDATIGAGADTGDRSTIANTNIRGGDKLPHDTFRSGLRKPRIVLS